MRWSRNTSLQVDALALHHVQAASALCTRATEDYVKEKRCRLKNMFCTVSAMIGFTNVGTSESVTIKIIFVFK